MKSLRVTTRDLPYPECGRLSVYYRGVGGIGTVLTLVFI